MYIRYAQNIRKFGQQVSIMHNQLNDPFGNRTITTVSNGVFLNYLSAWIIDYKLIVKRIFEKHESYIYDKLNIYLVDQSSPKQFVVTSKIISSHAELLFILKGKESVFQFTNCNVDF